MSSAQGGRSDWGTYRGHWCGTAPCVGEALPPGVFTGARQEKGSMEYRKLGGSGLMVPALSLGTGTFGGAGFLEAWGSTQAAEATRMVDLCLEAGLNLFDSADVYSEGRAEEVL